MNQHHVVFNSEKKEWQILKAGSKRPSGHFPKKQDAVKRAREISKKQGTELVIHGKDGQIQSSDSHGHDSPNIKG